MAIDDLVLDGSNELLATRAARVPRVVALRAIGEFTEAGELSAALRLIQALGQARRTDVLMRYGQALPGLLWLICVCHLILMFPSFNECSWV